MMIHFIVNPSSAGGRGKKVWDKLEQALRVKEVPHQVHFTRRYRHAIELVEQILQKESVQAVVAVGGDGTVHETAQPLVGTTVPLGFIPAGSGNDFARSLGIPRNVEQALDRILEQNPHPIDVGEMNGSYFMNGAGIGFDGAVSKRTNHSKRKKWLNQWKLGRFSYTMNVLQLLFTYQPTDIRLSVDGKEHVYSGVWLAAISNMPNYGGGMKICPQAVYDDGLLDLIIVTQHTPWKLLRNFGKVYRGTHIHEKGIHLLRAEEVVISNEKRLPIHLDGEIYDFHPIHIKVKKGALYVL